MEMWPPLNINHDLTKDPNIYAMSTYAMSTFEEPLRAIQTLRWEFVVAERSEELADKDVCLDGGVPGAHVARDHLHLIPPHLLAQILQPGGDNGMHLHVRRETMYKRNSEALFSTCIRLA